MQLSKPTPSMSYTTDYDYIDFALQSRWSTFSQLEKEVLDFVPKSLEDLLSDREVELGKLRANNPHLTDDHLLRHIDEQFKYMAAPELQVYLKFDQRIMGEYVVVAFLSHALSEAAVNALLAIGLATNATSEVFSVIERAEVVEKWVVGPKAFNPSYALSKASSMYETLRYLVRQRNALIHSKIELSVAGELHHPGSRLDRPPLLKRLNWIRRFFSLPYDLTNHARCQIPDLHFIPLMGLGPIENFAPHKKA